MKKNALIFMFLFLLCVGCNIYKKPTISKDAKKYIRLCADSLNEVHITKIVPKFLYDPCLDYQKKYWINLHTPISLRKMILDNVNSKLSLEYILKLDASQFFQLCDKKDEKDTLGLNYYTVPRAEMTFEQLIKERYTDLR